MSARAAIPPPPTRRTWRFWIVVVGLGTILIAGLVWRQSGRPVNILMITLDTTRADRIGCYGDARAETPTLDSLAARGILFERAYAPAPMTAPSHASMLTGLWPPEHGVFTNGQVALDDGISTIAERLSYQGFDTAAFVAAFVLQAKFGFNRGFSVYDDDLSTAEPGGDELHRYRDGKYVIDSAIRWLTQREKSNRSSPFFCWVHLYDPHDPYLAHPMEFGDQFADRPYDGEIAYVDRQLGRLFNTLKKLELNQNTVIVVVGDHGESLGEHGERTHGYMLHESTLRVPLIIAGPRSPVPGTRVATPVSLVDLFPTMVEIGGGTVTDEFQKRSLAPALRGKSLEARPCYSQTEEPYLQAFWSPLQGLTTDQWRYVRSTKPELYDLAKDPEERINLAAKQPEKVLELEEELTAFEARFQRRTGARVALSSREQRALESLGYVGGGPEGAKDNRPKKELPDIKDMIGFLNQLHDATDLIDEGNYDQAAVILEPLAERVPNLFRARLNLGMCRLHKKQFDDAARWLQSALEIDPNSDRAHDMLGFTYLKLKKLDLAERHFQRLLELRPDSETAHLFLGEIAQRREDFSSAMRLYAETLRINPQNRQAREAFEALQQAGIRF